MARPETFTDAAFLLFLGPLAQRLKKLVRWLVPACFGAMLAAGDALHAEMDPQVLDRYRDCGMLLHLPTSRGTMPLPQGMPFGAGYWVVRNSRGGWAAVFGTEYDISVHSIDGCRPIESYVPKSKGRR